MDPRTSGLKYTFKVNSLRSLVIRTIPTVLKMVISVHCALSCTRTLTFYVYCAANNITVCDNGRCDVLQSREIRHVPSTTRDILS